MTPFFRDALLIICGGTVLAGVASPLLGYTNIEASLIVSFGAACIGLIVESTTSDDNRCKTVADILFRYQRKRK